MEDKLYISYQESRLVRRRFDDKIDASTKPPNFVSYICVEESTTEHQENACAAQQVGSRRFPPASYELAPRGESSTTIQMRAMRTKNLVCLVCLLIIQFLILHYLVLTGREDKFSESSELNLPHQDNFVWSAKIQDWLIVDQANRASGSWINTEHTLCVWPGDQRLQRRCSHDRIVEQLLLSQQLNNIFKICIANDASQPEGGEIFESLQCRVNRCSMTNNQREADAIIFPNADVVPNEEVSGVKLEKSRLEQVWIAYLLESPENTFDRRFKRRFRGAAEFNWTSTYRTDSTIVTPYSKFVPYESELDKFVALKEGSLGAEVTFRRWKSAFRVGSNDEPQHGDYSTQNATIVWFVSNCHAKNKRLEYVQELAKHIKVDIYGKCGSLKCEKQLGRDCDRLVYENYKFYLSFENSNAREYITEKLYKNALNYNEAHRSVLPVVMGARREDYRRLAPPGSYIHVEDFAGPKLLAKYLRYLDSNEQAYESYFLWKKVGRFIETKFLCRVCAMLHLSHKEKRKQVVSELVEWWLAGKASDRR